jgi:hypothetical protein
MGKGIGIELYYHVAVIGGGAVGLTCYDDNLVRHENAAEVAQPGVFTAVACPDCRQYVNATMERCPACGQDMDPCRVWRSPDMAFS